MDLGGKESGMGYVKGDRRFGDVWKVEDLCEVVVKRCDRAEYKG